MSAKRIVIFNHGPGRQHGAALMVMLVILVLGSVTIFVSSLNSSTLKIVRDKTTADALAQAKDALIGYAITYGDTHSGQVDGYLLCPDNASGNPEGSAEPNCGNKNVSVIGRLPWKTLGLSPLRDGNGECLWYAISGTYKNNPPTGLMNWDNNGLFKILAANGQVITGQTADSQAVAIIFAPGVPLAGQNRAPDGSAPICGGNYNASNYLDSDPAISANNATPSNIANTISNFFTAGSSAKINDQLIYITRDDIFNAIRKRNDFQINSPNNVLYKMTQAAATCLASASPRLPAPTQLNPSNPQDGWVPAASLTSTNCGATTFNTWKYWWANWGDHLFYDTSQAADVNGTVYDAEIIFANPKLAGQNRILTTDKSNPANYLDGANLSTFNTGAPDYQMPPLSNLSNTLNDVLFCVPSGATSAILCP
jgi:type II secretory pathway pseudopilin PulG